MIVTMQVIQARLFDRLRALDGATYSPTAGSDFSSDLVGYGTAAIPIAAPPAKIDGVRDGVRTIIADLAANPINDDELIRAKQPLLEQRLRDREANGYWFGALENSVRNPQHLQMIRERVTALQAITAADVRRVCHLYLMAHQLILIVRSTIH